ncbi:DUF3570 domain-containing protein [Ferruginibacter sp. SUN002]|uniref:DUF3570 domain-containing protein n=1 Tax=Ferruginibacter sp. SUN002 TaxID=2937789 RepID=UPI003D361330
MKKICLVVVGLYVSLLNAFSQTTDTAQYKSRTLKLDEVNLVSSYYHQDGNNSSVTGGIGTEKLSDLANSIDVKLSLYDKHGRKHGLDIDAGVDYYTSASSDKIDLKANSSASSSDVRFYPSVSWTRENEKKGTTIGLNASYSTEFDYQSFGIGASVFQKSKNRNAEFGFKAQAYFDAVSMILPTELRQGGGRHDDDDDDYPTSARNSYSGTFSYSQIVNQRLQLMVLLDIAYQNGFLALPFHRVYLNNNAVRSELLPSSRFKLPVSLRANYFLGDNIVLRSFYRFYHDDWGLNAHTAELEASVKINPFLSVAPFYRYYTQTAIDYFAGYKEHTTADNFYTSNYDLSKFNSQFLGAGVRFVPPKGIFGIRHWNMVELRYGYYKRSNTLHSNIITLNLKFK